MKIVVYYLKKRVLPFFLLVFISVPILAQQNRFADLEQQLNNLSNQLPGLKEKVDISISGSSIQEFLRGLAIANQLNINIDPQLNIKVYNNFTRETVSNIIIFLAREYDLDVRFVGTIMSFSKYKPVVEVVAPTVRQIDVRYNSYTQLLSMDLRSDTLSSVVRKITQLTKKNVISSADLSGKTVSIYLEDVPIEEAVEKMAMVNELKSTKTSENFFLIQKQDASDPNMLASNGQMGNFSQNRGQPYRNPSGQPSYGGGSGRVFVHTTDSLGNRYVDVNAMNAPFSEVLDAVAHEMNINYFLYSDLKGNITTQVSKLTFEDFLSRFFRGTDYTFQNEKGVYLVGDRKLEGLRANRLFQFQFRSLETVEEAIPAELRRGVEIKNFKELNGILLSGSLPQILEVEAFLKQIDRVVPLVMIEVTLVDVRKTRTISTGIKMGLGDSTTVTRGSILPGVDFTLSSSSINDLLSRISSVTPLNIGRVAPNFYVGLSALEANNNVEVRSMPKLSTLNGHSATLSIGSTRYYSVKTQNVVGTLTPQTVITEQFNAVQANLGIAITPIVSSDDQVTLTIDVGIADFIGDPPNNAPPPSSNSQFKSIIRVRNEEMVVLGGLERTENSKSGSGTPLLSRIPLIGRLFSSKSNSHNKTVSIVFIKPTIIY
ncbi:type II and III secretion system protein [Cytophagaceae bacterium YF14B1]|uniref:Type II and III secretion system protein n=1 Tax=Xanthocytophaga flava TaxID=3048013 RepID=A0AAE3R0Z8_9BACT|nr:type II and III secretion system protein [Xanthocytophaga flavus]MDJ1486098.1 type II and III secretion system protein [Xanthocytophaga flavus]